MAYEIEKAVLFYLTEGFDSSRLNEDLFSYPDYKIIFREIRKRQGQNFPIDYISLSEALSGQISPSYIFALGDGVIRGSFGENYFQDYVFQLLRLEKERQIKAVIGQAIKEPDFLPTLKSLLADYEPEADRDVKAFSMAVQTAAFRSYIETRRGSKLWGHDLKSLPVLAGALMGIREIIVLAAKAKTGKSTLALQIASDLYSQGIPVLYFDFENGAFNLMARELSRTNSLSFKEIFSDSGDRPAFVESGILKLQEYQNFSIIMDRKLTIEKIRAYVKQAKRAACRSDVFIVIDSLQKLPMENLRERRAAVDLWLRGFEELMAEDPALSILLISELSREGGKPKESGDIEYTGHFLLELEAGRTEEEVRKFGDDSSRRLWLRFARDIGCPKDPINLIFHPDQWRMEEKTDEY
jgi:hypothetical protein